MKSPNHAIIMLKLGQQIQKEQEGNTAMIQLHETETKAIRQAKEESRAKIALCYMLHKIYTSKLDRSQSQKELWPIHLATQVIPKSLIFLQPFQVQYHSKNTHSSTLGKKRLRIELKPCFSLSQLQHLHWASFQRENREKRISLLVLPRPRTWIDLEIKLHRSVQGTAFMTFLTGWHRALY